MVNRKEIDNLFLPKLKKGEEGYEEQYKNDEVIKAHLDIVGLQKGDKQGLRTGLDHTDYKLIGGLSNKMVFYGSRPSMGKTYLCDQIITNLGDKEINPMPVETLRLNWEMVTKMLLLRKLKIQLGKSMREIVTTPYTEEEKTVVKEVVKTLRRDDLKNYSKVVEGQDLRYMIKSFCEKGDPDAEKVILVDHIHILGKKDRIDAFLTICNEMKLEYNKLSFIFFFQLNRELETYWKGTRDNKPNPKNFRPNSVHIYNTDTLMQYADLICTIIIPQVVNLDEYAAVYRDFYEHLKEHFVDDDIDADWVRLEGRNRIFYEYIKDRLIDDFDEPKLFCSILDEKRELGIKAAPTVKSIVHSPDFNKEVDETETEVKEKKPLPLIEPVDAFDLPEFTEEEDNPPF